MPMISYPTQTDVEQFLNRTFPSPAPFNLSTSISTIGTIVGAHKAPGVSGTLQGAIVPGAAITGLDIPVLISDNFESKGTVMIIEQDPLRNPNDPLLAPLKSYFPTHAIVGTPNALHYNVSVTPHTNIYRCIVDYILNKHYNVYITDANKLYWPYTAGSNALKRWESNLAQQGLLRTEINIINPVAFLLVGKVAQTAYNSLYLNHPNVIPIPHIKARSSAWAKIGVIPASDANKLHHIKAKLSQNGIK